jgi:hypothetical protein
MQPIELAKQIEARYRRYLETTFYFRDPELRASFRDALSAGHLSKGPYLEATPVFRRGQAPQTLFPTLLAREADAGFLKAVDGERPLYWHQEEAVRRVSCGENVVVATGTASGKTEAFIFPILLHLYREFLAGTLDDPGVRALILYPMNALANDQRDRLGAISRELLECNSPFRFEFGQYIGETPKHENDPWRGGEDYPPAPGELVLRSEMQRHPPHILLTNYSMLEYLLLRPEDSPLFDNGRGRAWKFLVLDEAHQYRGSRGIEMAMLLRRLKQRLREGGRTGPFQCIATSATLLSGEEDRTAVKTFASDLFGEPFHEDGIILGQTQAIPDPSPDHLGQPEYTLLRNVLGTDNSQSRGPLEQLASGLGVTLPLGEPTSRLVGRILQHDGRATRLRQLITRGADEVQAVAETVFGELSEKARVPALAALVELLLQSREPESGAPLLSARYHLFLKSLEGAFVVYWPRKQVLLDRGTGGEGAAFEVALCRECGQHYFVGPKNFRGGKVTEATRDPGHPDFGATFFRPVENAQNDAEEEEEEGNEGANNQLFRLCVQCGELGRGSPSCGHSAIIDVVQAEAPAGEERADQMKRCGACGYDAAGRDPVREVVYGADGPHAVIATTLYGALKSKKVLAFADGRQEAAFFAWYLEDSYRDILSRNLVLKVARTFEGKYADGLSLRTIASHALNRYADGFKERESDDEPTILKNVWSALYREFLSPEQRICLEGVGLIRWSIKWPRWFRISTCLQEPPWSLTEQEAWGAMTILLDSIRTHQAMELRSEKTVSLNWDELGIQPSQTCFRIGASRRPKGYRFWPVRSWDGVGPHGHIILTLRTMFLARILAKGGMAQEEAVAKSVEALRKIWADFQNYEASQPSDERLLLPVPSYDARRLNPDWWRLQLVPDDGVLFQCNTCGRLQGVSIRGVCAYHRCPGVLREVRRQDLEPNHYRSLYEEELPGRMRVEEHTAQLDKKTAREFQRDFKSGRINVLSSSTTFELGVDLGDLDTIFLRNIPPEAFNYAQRVGRAGRRSGHPGFAISYCRRNPHDLYHFSEPERMLGGKVRPPVLSLQNDKIITRHIAATALSAFFRDSPERFENVERLFQDLSSPSGVADFKVFLTVRRRTLEDAIRAIVPTEMHQRIGLQDGGWIEKVAGDESRLAEAELGVSGDYRKVQEVKVAALQNEDPERIKWAKDRANTIVREDVLSFLSRKAVIPKYGFPVDVVELDTQKARQNQDASHVLLQRDLSIAISEFAPTAKLVANKKLWTSYGLKRVAEREWDRWWYARCPRCNRFDRIRWGGETQPPQFGKCCVERKTHKYVDPRFGFVTSGDKPEEPKGRPPKLFTTRPYFAEFKVEPAGQVPMGPVTLTTVSPGCMVVLCEGRRGSGFYVCGACGAGFRARPKTHKNPYRQDCPGTFAEVSLGHEFVTDVLRIQFSRPPESNVEPVWFAYSLAYSLLEGAASAEVLEVPSDDLNATVAYGSERSLIPPIILYDNVPGGAGLVARLQDQKTFEACLKASHRRVGGSCGCGEDTSCYGCLRTYRNQFAHQHLQRGPVLRYLEAILSQFSP